MLARRGLRQRISFVLCKDGRRLFGYRDAVLIFCGLMGVGCREMMKNVGFDRDGVLGFGSWLFLSGGLGILAVRGWEVQSR